MRQVPKGRQRRQRQALPPAPSFSSACEAELRPFNSAYRSQPLRYMQQYYDIILFLYDTLYTVQQYCIIKDLGWTLHTTHGRDQNLMQPFALWVASKIRRLFRHHYNRGTPGHSRAPTQKSAHFNQQRHMSTFSEGQKISDLLFLSHHQRGRYFNFAETWKKKNNTPEKKKARQMQPPQQYRVRSSCTATTPPTWTTGFEITHTQFFVFQKSETL